jgi:hypothetical protein
MSYMNNHELARIRQQEIARHAEQRSRIGDLPAQNRTGRIRSLRRSDGSLWIFRLPRNATA